MSRPVAFFDIDGTVFRSSLLIELTEALIEAEVFPDTTRDEYSTARHAWRSREGTYEAYLDKVITAFRRYLKGVHYGALADVGRVVVARHSSYVYRYTRDLLTELRQGGYALIAISQSPKTLLDDFCARYGFDKVYGRIYEIGPQDCFTGAVTDEFLIENKAAIVERIFSRHPEFSRQGTVAVGDTESDIPLLEAVEKPICFNPNAALYTHAKARRWPVVVERKDVIYHL
jgi:HAD superfamily hydrolase (TIGR01490 family)